MIKKKKTKQRGVLQVVGWVSSSSWVSADIWCDAPASRAPPAAARQNRQAWSPVREEEVGGLRGKPEEEEQEVEGPRRG